jgi:hypothetical protein
MSYDDDSGYDEFGLPRETGFTGNAIAIDPAGCGCTDCILRYAIHVNDTANMERLAKAAVAGRKVVNRSYGGIALVVHFDGTPESIDVQKSHMLLAVLPTD